MKDPVVIALAANGEYFAGLIVTAYSMAMYAEKDADLEFHILDGGIEGPQYALLVSRLQSVHSRTVLIRHVIDQQAMGIRKAWKGNFIAYARLLLPEIIPERDFVIYSDVDFVWMKDVCTLWRERSADTALCAVHDYVDKTLDREHEIFVRHAWRFDRERYFCSGMCILNLSLFRKQGIHERCLKIVRENDDLFYPDQTAMNVIFAADAGLRLRLLDRSWMMFTIVVEHVDIAAGVALHYAGSGPWTVLAFRAANGSRSRLVSDMMMIWYGFYAKALGVPLWRALDDCFGIGRMVRRRLRCLWLRTPPMSWIVRRRAQTSSRMKALEWEARKLGTPPNPLEL